MGKQKGAIISIISNSSLVILKLLVGLFTGSISIISDGLHSGIDLIASFIAYVSVKQSSKEKDDDHNYGHGKYENVSCLVESLLILLTGIIIGIEAIKKIIEPPTITNVDLGIGVMVLAIIINIIVSIYLLKLAKKENSLALEADGMHILADVYSSIGVIVGLILVKVTGYAIADPIMALIISIYIMNISRGLIKKSLDDLVDKSLDKNDLDVITDILNKYPEVKFYHKLRTRKNGTCYEIDVHIKLDKDMCLDTVHNVCNSIENNIKGIYPYSYIVLHPEPYKNE